MTQNIVLKEGKEEKIRCKIIYHPGEKYQM